ncbi:MAG TPA: hypothetical protein IAB59_00885 [Candidatus Onthousia faecipullorum]|uniref:Uncharacterized protein n=1 Tax=Candidatus Onthousia faecipullorum TaxID=2840887 RepID=A0A9D1KC66_9FIRM|nr:hypothetical protein [Candidatus Onthousia faecipullorum]
MKDKNKSIRNLTIGAVTGGLIVGGAVFALNDRKPFIRDYIETYQVTTDATIRTTEGLTRLNPNSQFLTSDEIEEMKELEIKSYTQTKDNYDVDVYGFLNDSLTDEEIATKQNQFENGNSLSAITNYDNTDEYQVETRELPASYENILEEISIKNVNYDSVITVRESNKVNMEDTSFWIIITAVGAYIGLMCGNLVSELDSKVNKKTK